MNTRTLWIGAVLILAAGCNTNDRRAGDGSVLDNDNNRQARITVTGCLQPAEQGLSREPNSASRSAEDVDRFMLTNATPAAQSSSSSQSSQPSPSSSSASSTAATAATGPLYMLEGKTDELRRHIGQQVEITGQPEEKSDNNRDASNPNQAVAQQLEVESVRMIAQNCVTR